MSKRRGGKNKRWKFVPRKCEHCLKWFGDERAFADHMKHKHPEIKDEQRID